MSLNPMDDSAWLFQSPMFTLVNPNDILCPLEILTDNHSEQQLVKYEPQEQQQQIHPQHVDFSHTHCLVEPPPTLVPYNETPKLLIHHKLELHRVMSIQRRERIRERFEQQPAQLPLKMFRKGNGKLTGRERFIELEKEERHLIQQRNQYRDKINTLEAKCNKLRAILGNIVNTSPQYNAEMIHFLETSQLLYDNNENESLLAHSENLPKSAIIANKQLQTYPYRRR